MLLNNYQSYKLEPELLNQLAYYIKFTVGQGVYVMAIQPIRRHGSKRIL